MFYSHEVLTSRKYGVATIWLVATLGSRSTLKKVTRKAILDVDVPKACETITDTGTPMALRLQGSLLFGVSRVFSQQCGYVLSDMQSLHDKMRGAAVVMRDLQIDNGVTVTNDQLNLRTDPSFNIDVDMGLDLSVFDFDTSTEPTSRSDSLSSHSLPSTQSSLGPANESNPLLPTQLESASREDVPNLGFDIELATSEVPRAGEHADLSNTFEGPAIDEDPSFDIGDDGGLIFRQDSDQATRNHTTAYMGGRPGSDVDVETAVDSEKAREVSFDDGCALLGENEPLLPQIETSSSSADVSPDRNAQALSLPLVPQREETETTAGAPQTQVRPARPLRADRNTELSSKQLKEWSERYVDTTVGSAKQTLAQARRKAAFWVLEQGLGGVSVNLAGDRETHPLSIFSGQALLNALTGSESPITGSKRRHSVTGSEAEREQTGRARDLPNDGMSIVEGHGGIIDNNGLIIQEDDIESEIGRRPRSSLQDRPSLSMPWNILASSRQGSVQESLHPGVGSSVRRGPPSVLSGRRSRLTTASPLVSRGQLPSQLDSPRLRLGDDSMDIDVGDYADFPASFTSEAGGDFQLYDAIMEPDTHQANQSQQSIAKLDDEAYNFLQFLDEQIKNNAGQDGSQLSITFDELLPPRLTSKAVVAHGFMHVLALATKGLINIQQEQAFGGISLGLTSHNEEAGGSDNGHEIMA